MVSISCGLRPRSSLRISPLSMTTLFFNCSAKSCSPNCSLSGPNNNEFVTSFSNLSSAETSFFGLGYLFSGGERCTEMRTHAFFLKKERERERRFKGMLHLINKKILLIPDTSRSSFSSRILPKKPVIPDKKQVRR